MKTITQIMAIAIIAALPVGGYSQPPKDTAKPPAKPAMKAAAPKCAACGMTLSAKKTKMNTKAVKIKGKTWYCCAACKMK